MPNNTDYTVASAQQYLGTRTSPTTAHAPDSPNTPPTRTKSFVPTPKNFSPTDEADALENRQSKNYRASSSTLGTAELWYLRDQFQILSTASEQKEDEGESAKGQALVLEPKEYNSDAVASSRTGKTVLAPTVFDKTIIAPGINHSVPIIASPVPSPKNRGPTGSKARATSQSWTEPPYTHDIPPTPIQPEVTITDSPSPLAPPEPTPNTLRGRLAAHSPNSSAGSTGTEIYFSPISATRSQVFLSSPQPSPPLPIPSVEVSPASTPGSGMAEIPGIGRLASRQKVTLTLQQLDQLTLALASAPLVQKHIRATTPSTTLTETATLGVLPTPPPSPPAPPVSYPITSSPLGGIALLDPSAPGIPITLSSTPTLSLNTSTCLHLPPSRRTTSTLRIEPATHILGESKLLLQILAPVVPRGTPPDLVLRTGKEEVLLAEVDVTTSFQRAALTELALRQKLTLDEIEIATPTDRHREGSGRERERERYKSTLTHWPSTEEMVDWCAIGDSLSPATSLRLPSHDPAAVSERCVSYTRDVVTEALLQTRELSAETCAMQTLTLLSELRRLEREHSEFLILQPTRWDGAGRVSGVKVPSVSGGLRERFAGAGGRSEQGSVNTSSTGSGSRARVFREAVVGAVTPWMREREEFETRVRGEGGREVEVRCVPLFGRFDGVGEGRVEKWVVFCGV